MTGHASTLALGRIVVALALVLAQASVAYADRCEGFVAKSKPVLEAFTKEDGRRAFTPAEYAYTVARCRRDAEPPLRLHVACVLAAKDQAATQRCWEDAHFTPGLTVYGGESAYATFVRTEAEVHLERLRKSGHVYFNTMGEGFPRGGGGLLPPGPPCCKRPGKICPELDWGDIPWAKDAEFSVGDPTLFQYLYRSDGKTAIATAVGDIECDGRTETYTLNMSVKDGEAVWELILPKPPPAPKARATSKKR